MGVMRGQVSQAGPAAATVILTALFIILYILFLPPADRQALLGNASANTSDQTIVSHYDVFVNESPGAVSPQMNLSQSQSLNSFTLTAQGSYVPVFSSGQTQVYSSRYDRKVFERSFKVSAIPTDARMSISLEDLSGAVRVIVNGKEVYSGTPIARSNKEILDLPLVRGTNNLTIESADRWWFWGRNYANIDSVSVVANVYNPSYATATQRFSTPSDNRQYLNRAYLVFLLDCGSNATHQQMLVSLNGQLVGSAVYDCNSPQQIELPISTLQDSNTISFKTSTGIASIQAPTVHLQYNQAVYPLYYFHLNDSQYTAIQNGNKKAILYFKFVRDGKDKDIIANVNGNYVSVATSGDTFRTDVTSYIESGENYLQIEPRLPATIVKLQLFLQASS